MSIRYAVCDIVDAGEEGLRLAIAQVVDPATGFQAFNVTPFIAINPDGTLPLPWGFAVAEGDRWDLAAVAPGVTLLPSYPLDAAVSAMHLPTRIAMGQALQARGIAVASIATADGFRDVVNYLGRLVEPAFDVDRVSP